MNKVNISSYNKTPLCWHFTALRWSLAIAKRAARGPWPAIWRHIDSSLGHHHLVLSSSSRVSVMLHCNPANPIIVIDIQFIKTVIFSPCWQSCQMDVTRAEEQDVNNLGRWLASGWVTFRAPTVNWPMGERLSAPSHLDKVVLTAQGIVLLLELQCTWIRNNHNCVIISPPNFAVSCNWNNNKTIWQHGIDTFGFKRVHT